MSVAMPIFSPETLSRACTAALCACGVSAEDARLVADHLVDAELDGVSSHGVIRLPQYVDAVEQGKIRPAATLTVIRQQRSVAVLDGGHGFGQVMAQRAMGVAVDMARHAGIAAVTLVHCSHTGRLGAYTGRAAREGMLGMMMVNAGGSGQWVAPFGGTAGRLATNPMSLAVPRDDGPPLVVDFATSTVPEGKVRAKRTAGATLPAGWLIDARGHPSTDPADLYGPPRGAILPFGAAQAHKGYGLALMVDLFAGALSGAGVCRPGAPRDPETDGVFLLAVDPAAFGRPADFLARVRQLVAHVKSSPPAAAFDEVLVPGEREAKSRERGLAGGIPLDVGVWRSIDDVLDRLHVGIPHDTESPAD